MRITGWYIAALAMMFIGAGSSIAQLPPGIQENSALNPIQGLSTKDLGRLIGLAGRADGTGGPFRVDFYQGGTPEDGGVVGGVDNGKRGLTGLSTSLFLDIRVTRTCSEHRAGCDLSHDY